MKRSIIKGEMIKGEEGRRRRELTLSATKSIDRVSSSAGRASVNDLRPKRGMNQLNRSPYLQRGS